MNQKNIFTAISVVLALQGVAFYFMGDTIAGDSFPTLEESGRHSVGVIMQVVGLLSVLVGLISYAVRSNAAVLWAYLLGFGLLTLNTLKHKFIDHLNVPIPAIVIQVAIVLACAYLWSQNRNATAS